MWKVYLRMGCIVAVLTVAMAPVWFFRRIGSNRQAYMATRFACRITARLMGMRVIVRGQPNHVRPLLIVSNHISYLDIIAYGSVLPIVYTPKSEIATWPLIGPICRLIGCVFIDRKAVRTSDNMDNIKKALAGDRPVLLFAEGTTSDSKRILPLRSSYFSITQEGGIMVQPALLAYTKIHGLPVDSTTRPLIAWYGNMDFLPHLKTLLKSGPILAEIEFFPVVNPQDFENRKILSTHLEEILTVAHQNLL